jgi:transcriptional regulator with XRE-family HTH domain
MSARSDIDAVLDEQRKRPDWPTERALIADFAIQIAMIFEKLREEQGLSYQELADKAGTSKPHVIRLLGGTYAGISNRSIAKLCKALGCELTIQHRPTQATRPVRIPQPALAVRVPTRASSRAPGPIVARTGRRAAG